eukprot:XP_002938375.2 PREDICTED: uncharacterized protein LOC100496853 [Xenopus tropicalis]
MKNPTQLKDKRLKENMASLIFQFITALCVLKHALCFDCANSIPLSGKERGEITLPGVGRGNIYIYKWSVYADNEWNDIVRKSGGVTAYGNDRYNGRLRPSYSYSLVISNLRVGDSGTYRAGIVEYDMVYFKCYNLTVAENWVC